MSARHATLRRACGCAGKKEDTRLRRRADAARSRGPAVAPAIVHQVLAGPGQALDERARPIAQSVLGPGFGDVRIHADARAAESAAAVGALAYAAGRHVVFGAGLYAPGTAEGDRLLAHELAHVAQQRGATIPAVLPIGDPASGFEAEADRVAAGALAAPLAAAPAAVQRILLRQPVYSCSGRNGYNCNGVRCRAASGRLGVCQWGGTKIGCNCRDQSSDEPAPHRVMDLFPAWLLALLSAAAIAAIIACFASGVCEAGIIIGTAGAATAAAVIAILRANGITVTDSPTSA